MDCKHITELQIKVSYNPSDLYDQRKFYIFIETEFCYAQTYTRYPQNWPELFFPGAAGSFGLLLLHCGGLLSSGGHPLGRHRLLCLGPGDLPALVLAAAGPVPLPVTRVGQLLAET